MKHAGFLGSILDFNDHVERIADAHRNTFGYDPPPGLTLDVAKSTLGIQDYPKLFPSASKRAFLAGAAIGSTYQDPADEFLRQYEQAKTEGITSKLKFLHDHEEQLHEYMQDPEFKVKFAGAYLRGEQGYTAQQASVFRPSFFSKALGFGALATEQVATGLTVGPAVFAWEEGKATYHDVGAVVHGNLPTSLVKTNVRLVKGVVAQLKQDILHPGDNAGNLFLDALGLFSLGAGIATRGAAMGRAGMAGEGLRGVGRAAVRRPTAGTYEFHYGDAVAHPLLSENSALRTVQRIFYGQLQKVADLRHEGLIPAGATDAVGKSYSLRGLSALAHPLQALPVEAFMRAEWKAQDRVQAAVRQAIVQPVANAGHWSIRTSAVERLLGATRHKLTNAEQKAIQVLLTDVEGPFTNQLEVHRSFHKAMIEAGIGDAAAHGAQLEALTLAEKVLGKKPRPEFVKALDGIARVVDVMEAVKKNEMGLLPQTAEGRVAKAGATFRQEELVEGPGGGKAIRVPGEANYYELEREVRQTETVLRGEQAKLETLEQRLAKPPAKGAKRNRPQLQAAVEAQRRAVETWTKEAEQAKTRRDVEGPTIEPLQRVNPASRYLPFVSATRKLGKPTDAGSFWNPTVGPFGISLPGTDPSLTHEFTGHYIKTGDFRIDASNLAAEAYGKAVGSATKLNSWKRLHDASVADHRAGYKPIRSEAHIPEGLRRIVAKNENEPLVAEDMDALHTGTLGDFLFPDPKLTMEDDPSVRWVHPKILESRRTPQSPHLIKRLAVGVNEVLRDTILFAKPSYILNALGNAGMALLHQGPALIPNLLRAAAANRLYGAEAARMLDGAAGESRSLSYAPELATGRRLSNKLAAGWNRVTDRVWRRAAAIHELKRVGITDIRATLESYAKGEAPEELAARVVEASRRAKKAMVELDNLTWFEKESLRHYVFVYPWVSRSLVWSLRTIFEHPIKADVLAHVTAGAEQDKALQHAPDWLKNFGYIPTGFTKDGQPKVAGFGSINTFTTLSEAMALMNGTETIDQILGPGAELSLRLVENKDRFGNTYKTPVIGPLTDSLIGLPQYAAFTRAQKTGEPGYKPLDITNPQSLVEREHSALQGENKRAVFVPEGWSALWSLGIGGLHEKVVDKAAIDARFWRDQPVEKRHQHETELVNKMLRLQAGFLKQPLPKDVRGAVDLTFDREYAYKQFAKDHGRGPTVKERALITIDLLDQAGDINTAEAKKLRGKLDETKTPDIQNFTTGLLNNYAGGKALTAWRQDVETVASFDRRMLDYFIGNAVDAGVIAPEYRDAANVPDAALQSLGRRFLAYEKEIQSRQDAMKGKLRGDKSVLMTQLREWVDQQDKPVKIDGHTFPSLPRLAVSRLTTDQMRAHLVDVYLSSWDGLSVIDKELAGKKSSPAISTAWAAYKTGLAEAVAKLPADQRKLSAFQKRSVARQIDRAYRLNNAFLRDFDFAQRPRASQMRELRIFTQAPADAKDGFTQILDTARKFEIAVKNETLSKTVARQAWRDWIGGLVGDGKTGWIQTNDPALWGYLAPYVRRSPDFLYDLLN